MTGFSCHFERLIHQFESKGKERACVWRQLEGADMEGADLAKGPAIEEPFGAVGISVDWLAGGAFNLAEAAELDVVQHNPAARLNVRSEAKHVEQRPGVTMIGVDESETEFAGLSDLPNDIGFAAGVNADGGDEIGNEIGNFETDRPRFIDDAVGETVDGIDADPGVIGMLVVDRGGDDGGGKPGKRSNLNNAARSENAHQTSEKEIVARADAARIADTVQVYHPVEKFHFAGRGNFSRVPEFPG